MDFDLKVGRERRASTKAQLQLLGPRFLPGFMGDKQNKGLIGLRQLSATSLFNVDLLTIMSKLYDFLVEHAKFPFPPTGGLGSVSTTDISDFEVGLLEKEWKANHAVRDDTLVHKLCNTLENITGDTLLTGEHETRLLRRFSPKLEGYDDPDWDEDDQEWSENQNEAHVSFPKGSRLLKAKLILEIGSVIVGQGILHRRKRLFEAIWSVSL